MAQTYCVFCAKPVELMDGTHYACFNPECVAYNTGFPKARYAIFENMVVAAQEKLFELFSDNMPEKQKITSYLAAKMMQAIFPMLEKLTEGGG